MPIKQSPLLRPLLCASLSCVGALGQTCSQCVPTWTLGTPTLKNYCAQTEGATALTKYQPYNVSWPDGAQEVRNTAGGGECLGNDDCNYQDTVYCWPYFNTPSSSSGHWEEDEADGVAEFVTGVHGCPGNSLQGANLACEAGAVHRYTSNHTCNCPCTGNPNYACPQGANPECVSGRWSGCTDGSAGCPVPPPNPNCGSGYTLVCTSQGWVCQCNGGGCDVNCPILVDTKQQGFHLTDWQHGVRFKFRPNNEPTQLAWTDAAFANGWLALDRNGDGTIDNGTELFGNATPQPPSSTPNGFLALSVFDRPENGGNGNGVIDPGDAVYPHLLVWIDANHDGVSQPSELFTLPEVGIFQIGLNYRRSPFVDQYGNQFRYRGMVWDGGGLSREACWDVFLTSQAQ